MTVFYFKQKTAYEIRISDWSSDVCSSDLPPALRRGEIDVGLLLSPVPSDGLQLDELRSEGWLVAMPSDHRLADYDMIAISDFAGERFVDAHQAFGPGCHQQTQELFLSAGVLLPAVARSFRRIPMLILVPSGAGVA